MRGFSAGGFMPIKKYIPGATFGPETIKDMTTAFERIRKVLKLNDPDDPLIEVVAKKLLALHLRAPLTRKTPTISKARAPAWAFFI
jgi:hypothetical protein